MVFMVNSETGWAGHGKGKHSGLSFLFKKISSKNESVNGSGSASHPESLLAEKCPESGPESHPDSVSYYNISAAHREATI